MQIGSNCECTHDYECSSFWAVLDWSDKMDLCVIGRYRSEQVGVNKPLTSLFKMTKSILPYWSVILLSFQWASLDLPSSFHLIQYSKAPASPTCPGRSLLILAGDWLNSNLRWTLTDECKLFFFSSSSSSLRGDEVIMLVTEPDRDRLQWSAGQSNLFEPLRDASSRSVAHAPWVLCGRSAHKRSRAGRRRERFNRLHAQYTWLV